MIGPAIPIRVVARVHAALSVKTKSDPQGHAYGLSCSVDRDFLSESIGDGSFEHHFQLVAAPCFEGEFLMKHCRGALRKSTILI